MSVFTFHLIKVNYATAIKALLFPARFTGIKGLIHAEPMTGMTLGAPLLSTSRITIRQLAFLIQWEDEEAIDNFLQHHKWGKKFDQSWHVRLTFLRQWGTIDQFHIPKSVNEIYNPQDPVVAVTLARMKLIHVPRFIRWGRPAEKLVRDHQSSRLALAAIRFPRTVSTFSIWKSQEEMTNMVHGHSKTPQPKRHINAMKERDRKDFHYQFTTLRFKPIGEYGSWNGNSNIIQTLKSS